ncbi:hypothetical protein Y1Q_0005627 [Alligator mississippiensis]|uniref:Uncharacterized protein n=1 Tax=Alligator mississippiensis TaxID=8496 RepID=A0A151MFA6_ALLMI|nr:hypothetical protein Y1Q_0005627 [Alligator mississippiensis]
MWAGRKLFDFFGVGLESQLPSSQGAWQAGKCKSGSWNSCPSHWTGPVYSGSKIQRPHTFFSCLAIFWLNQAKLALLKSHKDRMARLEECEVFLLQIPEREQGASHSCAVNSCKGSHLTSAEAAQRFLDLKSPGLPSWSIRFRGVTPDLHQWKGL